MLDRNAPFLAREQIKRHVDTLNDEGPSALAVEWEVATLYALSCLGRVQHEPELGHSRVDVLFHSKAGDCSFVADVTTVSDRGKEKDNPRMPFAQELFRQVAKHRLKWEFFSYRIEGELENKQGTRRYRRMQLKLPKRSQFAEKIFNDQFRSFMKGIHQFPVRPHKLLVRRGDVHVEICYDPSKRTLLTTWPSYTVPYSLEGNPVYKALDNKADQLAATSYNNCRGVFLCDGGCDIFIRRHRGVDDFTMAQIIRHFFRKHPAVDFVLTVTSKTEHLTLGMAEPELNVCFYGNPFAEDDSHKRIYECIKSISSFWPQPIMDSHNAHYRPPECGRNEGISSYKGIGMELGKYKSTIRISSRVLLALLAGRITQEQFMKDHKLTRGNRQSKTWNIFEKQLLDGRLPSGVSLERCADKDDDLITFTFTEPDPAISPFHTPKKGLLERLTRKRL